MPGPVKLHKDVLDLLLGLLVHVLLVVGDQGLGERLPDGVHLRGVPAALHADTDVDVREPEDDEVDTEVETDGKWNRLLRVRYSLVTR